MRVPPNDLRPLAVLTTSYPAHPGDGAGVFVQGFCRACARAGIPVEVLCPEGSGAGAPVESVGAPGGPVAAPSIVVTRLAYVRPRRWQILGTAPGAPEALAASPLAWGPALAFGARLTGAVARRVRQGRYRGVVAHWLLPSALAAGLGAPGLPLVGVAHGSDVHLLSRLPGGARIARAILGRATGLCFVSEDLRARFGALLPASARRDLAARSWVQPMGVDHGAGTPEERPAARTAARAALGLAGPVVLWMGRLVPVKAPARALEIARALPDVTVVIAGAGPLRGALDAAARPLGPRVRWTGFVTGATKRALLAAADVVVISSTTLGDGRTDSLPVVALEALAAGRPVVATAVGGLPTLDVPGAALRLVPDGDGAALAQGVRCALDAGLLADSEQRALAARFGWEAALPRLLGPLWSGE